MVKKKPRGKPFPPGKSGNLGGRPKSKLRHFLGIVGEEVVDGQTHDERVARLLYEKAENGETIAIQILFQQKEGAAPPAYDENGDPAPDIDLEKATAMLAIVQANLLLLKVHAKR